MDLIREALESLIETKDRSVLEARVDMALKNIEYPFDQVFTAKRVLRALRENRPVNPIILEAVFATPKCIGWLKDAK